MTEIRICYIAAPTSVPVREKLVRDILSVSRNNNERDGITGVLMIFDGMFFQFVEGERERVHALMARIERDSRCGRVITLSEDVVNKRLFPNWSMAFYSKRQTSKSNGFDSIDVIVSRILNTRDTEPTLSVFFKSFAKK